MSSAGEIYPISAVSILHLSSRLTLGPDSPQRKDSVQETQDIATTSPFGSPNSDRRMSAEWGELSSSLPKLLHFPSLSLDIVDLPTVCPIGRRIQGPAQPLPEAQRLHLCRAQLARRPRRQQLPVQVPREAHRKGIPQDEIGRRGTEGFVEIGLIWFL